LQQRTDAPAAAHPLILHHRQRLQLLGAVMDDRVGLQPQRERPDLWEGHSRLQIRRRQLLGRQPDYELGVKTRWAVGGVPLQFNANAYHLDYKDIQRAGGDFNPTTGSVGVAVFNAGSARLDGVELEGALGPFHGFRLSGSYSYTDGKYREFNLFSPFGQVDCSGGYQVGVVDLSCSPFPNIAKNQYSLTGRYDFDLPGDAGQVKLTATYAYVGRQYTAPTSLPSVEPGAYLDSYQLLNASLSWTNVFNKPFDLMVFGTNLTDETYRISNSNVFNQIGSIASVYGEPRMWGVQVRYHW
jgi:iron complex outermembrane recepter protein